VFKRSVARPGRRAQNVSASIATLARRKRSIIKHPDGSDEVKMLQLLVDMKL
jgi:hypothetical protein